MYLSFAQSQRHPILQQVLLDTYERTQSNALFDLAH